MRQRRALILVVVVNAFTGCGTARPALPRIELHGGSTLGLPCPDESSVHPSTTLVLPFVLHPASNLRKATIKPEVEVRPRLGHATKVPFGPFVEDLAIKRPFRRQLQVSRSLISHDGTIHVSAAIFDENGAGQDSPNPVECDVRP